MSELSIKSVLPEQLAEYDDEVLAVAKELLGDLKVSDLTEKIQPEVVVLPDGRETFYKFFPNINADAANTVVHFQPVANGIKPQAISQVMAIQALNSQSVVFIPQNNSKLTRRERSLVKSGNFTPLAEQRLAILEHAASLGQIALDSIQLAGYSFGATDAAATMEAISVHDTGVVRAGIFGEPTNITERNLLKLGHDFASTSSKDLVNAVLMSQMPALIELWGVVEGDKSSAFMNKDFMGFARDFVKYRNLVPVKGLRYSKFADDVIAGLDAVTPESQIVLHKDLDSILTPEQSFDEQASRIATAGIARNVAVNVVKTTTEKKVGHAIGDNPWFWATLIRTALS